MDAWLLNLTLAGAAGSGLLAGLFFAFSVAIMPALRRLEHPAGMKAMQTINADIQSPLFLIVFVGSGVVGAALAASSIWTWDQPGAGFRLVGGTLAVGVVVLTAAYHVPRNIALDAVDPETSIATSGWTRYLEEWVPWNHVRTVASSASLVTLLLALDA